MIRAQPYGDLLYETEIGLQLHPGGAERHPRVDLILNEGQAVHSIYDPNHPDHPGPWDYFLVAPFFQPGTREADVDSLLLLGSAAGTTARQYTEVFGPVPIDGVEIDPQIIEVGRRYFHMTMPNLTAIARTPATTCARPPALPGDRRGRLPAAVHPLPPHHPRVLHRGERAPGAGRGGAINAGRTESDYRLVNVLAGTMKAVYPHVFVINIPTAINSIVVGTTGPSDVAQFRANLATIQHPVLRQVADVAAVSVCEYVPPAGPADPADPAGADRRPGSSRRPSAAPSPIPGALRLYRRSGPRGAGDRPDHPGLHPGQQLAPTGPGPPRPRPYPPSPRRAPSGGPDGGPSPILLPCL